jgi:hypothetical protein
METGSELLTLETSIERRAVALYGTTSSRFEAGYILRDGSMLDFSGKKDGGSAGARAMDHREVCELYPCNNFVYRSDAIDQFIKDTESIRACFDARGSFAVIDIIKDVGLSAIQVKVLANCLRNIETVTIDIYEKLFAPSPCKSICLDFPKTVDAINILSKYQKK